MSDKIPYWSFLPIAVLSLALAIWLSGCAMNEDYWIKVGTPVEIKGIYFTPTPGGNPNNLGYANFKTHMIEMKPDLPPALAECVAKHEAKHFAGYFHRSDRPQFAVDCGDGTLL